MLIPLRSSTGGVAACAAALALAATVSGATSSVGGRLETSPAACACSPGAEAPPRGPPRGRRKQQEISSGRCLLQSGARNRVFAVGQQGQAGEGEEEGDFAFSVVGESVEGSEDDEVAEENLSVEVAASRASKQRRPSSDGGGDEPKPERGGSFDEVPTVELALFLNNLDVVSTKTSTWMGDVVVRSRYREADFKDRSNPNQTISIELLDGRVQYRNEVRHWEENGTTTKMEHLYLSTHFHGDYDTFPFDSQELIIAVQLQGFSIEEARLIEWNGECGVRSRDNMTGRNFHTQQFYLKDWFFTVVPFKEHGFPYWKSRAELHVVIARIKAAYLLTCIFIPSFAICFALGAFFLPLAMIVPRMAMSFTSFLAIFVHMKQMSSLVPEGVWCWLLTDMVFYCAVLCALISANISSARSHKDAPRIAERVDALARSLLPGELALGQLLLLSFRSHHRLIGSLMVTIVLGTHAVGFASIFFSKELAEPEASSNSATGAGASQPIASGERKKASGRHHHEGRHGHHAASSPAASVSSRSSRGSRHLKGTGRKSVSGADDEHGLEQAGGAAVAEAGGADAHHDDGGAMAM